MSTQRELVKDPLKGVLKAQGFLLGEPRTRQIAIDAPIGGDDLLIPVPGGRIWEVMALAFTVTNDSTVATRRVNLRYMALGRILWEGMANSGQTASQVFRYNFAQGTERVTVQQSNVAIPLPQRIHLLPGTTILTEIITFQAGDSITEVMLSVKEYIEG